MTSHTALVAHPLPLIVEALAAIVTAAGYAVTRAGDAATATALAAEPDLALVACAFDTAAIVRARRPGSRPTILLCDDAGASAGVRAEGLVLTTAPVASVTACVAAVARGERWRDPALPAVDPASPPALTRRERDVATLVAAGQRNRTIAATLGISEGTVKMHLHNTYAKLGLESRTQLAMTLLAA